MSRLKATRSPGHHKSPQKSMSRLKRTLRPKSKMRKRKTCWPWNPPTLTNWKRKRRLFRRRRQHPTARPGTAAAVATRPETRGRGQEGGGAEEVAEAPVPRPPVPGQGPGHCPGADVALAPGEGRGLAQGQRLAVRQGGEVVKVGGYRGHLRPNRPSLARSTSST